MTSKIRYYIAEDIMRVYWWKGTFNMVQYHYAIAPGFPIKDIVLDLVKGELTPDEIKEYGITCNNNIEAYNKSSEWKWKQEARNHQVQGYMNELASIEG